MFNDKCPLCGTRGNLWNETPEAFRCPNCASVFSRYGLVVKSSDVKPILWH